MAGEWDEPVYNNDESYAGAGIYTMFKVSIGFTADATNGSIPPLTLSNLPSAFIADVRVKFTGGSEPNNIDLSILDEDGIEVVNVQAITGSQNIFMASRPSLMNTLVVKLTGNTATGAKGTLILYLLSNRR